MERAVEIYAAIQFVVIGLSHLFQPRAWVEFFVHLRGLGRPGVFMNGFLSLTFGALIVGFHNVWSGLPLVLTLIGWAQVVKGLTAFVAPELSMVGLRRVAPERAWEFQVPGVLFVALGVLLLARHAMAG